MGSSGGTESLYMRFWAATNFERHAIIRAAALREAWERATDCRCVDDYVGLCLLSWSPATVLFGSGSKLGELLRVVVVQLACRHGRFVLLWVEAAGGRVGAERAVIGTGGRYDR